MTRESRKDGGVFEFIYDDKGRCIKAVGIGGYDEKTFRYLDLVNWTEVTNSLGSVWRFNWNENGQIVAAVSPNGAVNRTEYDNNDRIAASINAEGGRTQYSYDEVGNRSSVQLPDGAEYKYDFNVQRRNTSVTNPAGATWKFQYDDTGKVSVATLPTGFEWRHTWTSKGDLSLVTNSAGGEWRYRYDDLGQLHEITDRSDSTIRYEYDQWGFQTRFIHPANGERRSERNIAGQLTQAMYPDGSVFKMAYDAGGNVVRTLVSPGGTYTFRYGRCCNQLLEEEAPDGSVTRYEWSTEPGRLDAIVDPMGERHSFQFNEDGYLIRETFSTGKLVSYLRNLKGEVIERVNGVGETTRYTRDACGRITRAVFFDGSEVSLEYGPNGKVVAAKNSAGTVRFERDLMGHRVREIFDDVTIENNYDSLGHRVSRKSSLGHETAYTYDHSGALTELAFSPHHQITAGYDQARREIIRTFGGVATLKQEYDAAGRLSAQNLDHLSERVVSRRFEYGETGKLSEMSDGKGDRTRYSYDLLGRLVERESTGDVERFAHDKNGNITWTERIDSGDAAVLKAEIGPGNQVWRHGNAHFQYDTDGRLTSKTEIGAFGEQRRWSYRWNALGLLAEITNPAGERWEYIYDAFGRRVRKSGPNFDRRYVWDGNAILHERDTTGSVLVTWTFSPQNFSPIAKQESSRCYFAVNDHLGTPRELVERSGRVVWSAFLTSFGEVKSQKALGTDCLVRFQGQWLDSESGLHYNNLRYYDPSLGAFISMDPVPLAAGINAYQYPADPVNAIDPHGLQPQYYPLDGQGRPTGAYGDLKPSDVRPTDTSPPSLDPPGWEGGAHPDHQQRSHLVADTLGGSGDDPRNIVALTDGSNHPGMSQEEAKIRNYLKANPDGSVTMEVRVEYDGENPTPSTVNMYALDENGNVIVDERIENGRRQNTKCCATT